MELSPPKVGSIVGCAGMVRGVGALVGGTTTDASHPLLLALISKVSLCVAAAQAPLAPGVTKTTLQRPVPMKLESNRMTAVVVGVVDVAAQSLVPQVYTQSLVAWALKGLSCVLDGTMEIQSLRVGLSDVKRT